MFISYKLNAIWTRQNTTHLNAASAEVLTALWSLHYCQNNGSLYFQTRRYDLIHVIMHHAFVMIPPEDDHLDDRNVLRVSRSFTFTWLCIVTNFFIIKPSWSCLKAVIKLAWHIPVPNVQCKTSDDGQRTCPKHVDFLDKNKFKENSASVGFIKKE